MKEITHMQINISAGSTIDEAIIEAMNKLEIAEIVSFDFNGTKFAITKNHKKEDIIRYWDMAIFANKWCIRY